MGTNNIDNTELRKLERISIDINTNNSSEEEKAEIKKINSSSVISFHFEEGISIPYTGMIKIKANEYIKISELDLSKLTIKIEYSLNYKTTDNEDGTETRQIYSLIKKISSLPRIKKNIYYYHLYLESPLDRLINNKDPIYTNNTITEILTSLLNTENNDSIYADFSEINSIPDSKKNIIQSDDKDVLNFIHRILIGYGINYVFNFKDPSHNISLTFSNSDNFLLVNNNQKEIQFTDELNNLTKVPDLIYCPNIIYENNNIKIKHAIEYSKWLRNNLINISSGDAIFSEQEHIQEYYKNICIRKLAVNATLSLNDIQDIRVVPGLKIKSYSDDNKNEFLVKNVITDISCNKVNILLQKVKCIELNELNYIKNNFTSLKDQDDYFDFDPKHKFGCLVPQKIVNFEDKENISNFKIIKAIACDKDGNVQKTDCYADNVTGINNTDLFYAYTQDNYKKKIIQVRSLVERNAMNVSKIYQGQEIFVLDNNGVYYLYGFIPKYFETCDLKLSHIEHELFNLNNKVSASTSSFDNIEDYLCSLIMSGESKVADAIKFYAAKTFNFSLYKNKYQKNLKEEVISINKQYNKIRSSLAENYTAVNTLNSQSRLTTFDKQRIKVLNSDIKTLQNSLNNETDKNSVISKIRTIAKNIITTCDLNSEIDPIKSNLFSLISDMGFRFNSDSGDFEINANNISLIANNTITINGKNIISIGEKSVTSTVGFSTINTKNNGTTISTGSTINGKQLNEDGTNQFNMLSSELKIATYKGISASAYNIKLTGHNGLSLNGPLKAGISLGYGTVKIVGTEVKLNTQSRFEQARNIVTTSSSFIFDIAQSCAAAKDNDDFLFFNYLCNTVLPTTVNVSKKFLDLSGKKKVEKGLKLWKGEKKSFDGNTMESDKFNAVLDIIDGVVKDIFAIFDMVMEICRKYVEEGEKLRYTIKHNKNKDFKEYDLLTKFDDNDLNKKLDQIELYCSHAKMTYTLLVAGLKVIASNEEFLPPSVSEFSINSSSAELKAANIGFEANKEETTSTAPSGGTVRHVLRETLTKVE